MLLKVLSHKLRDIRTARGYTQVELANMCGMERPYISNIERGLAPGVSIAAIERLANALEVDPLELLGGGPLEETAAQMRRLNTRDRELIDNLLTSMLDTADEE